MKLIIDTSTKYYYLCLLDGKKIVKERLIESNKNHAPNSVLLLEEALQGRIDDVTEVICGVGPGSYTGLRIALTIAKMICSFKEIPLKTISSLFLMSSGYDEKVVPIIDARRGNFFSACYTDTILEDKLRTKDEIESLVSDFIYVTEDMFMVDVLKVVKNAKEVSKVDEVVPNYLRLTEAEYNLKNDKKN